MKTSKETKAVAIENPQKITRKKQLKIRRFLLHMIIIVAGTVMLYPLIWMISSSFKTDAEIFSDASFWPTTFTLDNYVQGWSALGGATFGRFFINTFFLVGMSAIGNVIACSMAAYAFARLDFAFKKILFAIMLVTLMLPFHVTLIPQYIIFNGLDMVNTYWPLILPKFLAVEGFFIFLMVQFMRSIPKDLEEAARIDGCGPVKIYWKLIMPLTIPAVITTMIFTVIWTWNDFFSQLLYISDTNLYTVSLALRSFLDTMGQSTWGALFAMTTLSLIPLLAIFIFFQKYIIEGITSGGVKG